jgi:hypothetical protein
MLLLLLLLLLLFVSSVFVHVIIGGRGRRDLQLNKDVNKKTRRKTRQKARERKKQQYTTIGICAHVVPYSKFDVAVPVLENIYQEQTSEQAR